MSCIVIFGGTAEGRQLAEFFLDSELQIHISVATEYGAGLLPKRPNIRVHCGRMDKDEMKVFLSGLLPDFCVDATHPYAALATENICKACEETGVPYRRLLREEIGDFSAQEEVVYVDSAEEAADFLDHTTGKILITTGSRDLEKYTAIRDYKSRCIARVLPTVQVMEKCSSLGFEGKNVIGMQGPFCEELNYWMLKQLNAEWMVTKSSGECGGYREKCEAALRANARLVVIRRPEERSDALTLSETIRFLEDYYKIDRERKRPDKATRQVRKVYLIGMGPGSRKLICREAQECIENCDVLIGAKRILEPYIHENKPYYNSYRKDEILAYLKEHPQVYSAAVLYSGDIGFYSGARGMREALAEEGFQVIPVSGIASPIYFLNKLGIGWDEVHLVSCHGQDRNLIPLIRHERRVCTLIGKSDTITQTCKKLLDFHMDDVRITVGEWLSYPTERVVSGTPAELLKEKFDSLSLALFENPGCEPVRAGWGISDENFFRDRVPMTKQEIRVISLSKLKLSGGFVLYDIGAGTGSVSVEAALSRDDGYVYAIEKNPVAVSLILQNKNKFRTENLEVIEGTAPEAFRTLAAPTHVFIGGSGGNLIEIIRRVREKNENARFVLNAVTLETIAQIEEINREFDVYSDMEVVQVNTAKSRPLGGYHLMSAQNPVYIVSFGGKHGER